MTNKLFITVADILLCNVTFQIWSLVYALLVKQLIPYSLIMFMV